jgi:hypothetical protein
MIAVDNYLTLWLEGWLDEKNPYMSANEAEILNQALADWRCRVDYHYSLPVGEYTAMCWRHLLIANSPLDWLSSWH